MEGFLIDASSYSGEQLQELIEEMFGTSITDVHEPWHSYGPVLIVSPHIYFKGNLNNPGDRCGKDSLRMKLLTMNQDGVCPRDNALSFYLIPDEE